MSEKTNGSLGLSENNVERFINRVYNGKNLGAYDLIDRDDPVQREELALAILSEFVAESGLTLEKRLARAGMSASYLQDNPIASLREQYTDGRSNDYIKRSTTFQASFLEPATEGSKLLRDRLRNGQEVPSRPVETDYRAEAAVNAEEDFCYTDTAEVIRYLYVKGVVSPGHAKSLLVYFGYGGELTDATRQFALMARNDLRTRVRIQPVSMIIDEQREAVQCAVKRHIYDDTIIGRPFSDNTEADVVAMNRQLEDLLRLQVPYGSTLDIRSHQSPRTAS